MWDVVEENSDNGSFVRLVIQHNDTPKNSSRNKEENGWSGSFVKLLEAFRPKLHWVNKNSELPGAGSGGNHCKSLHVENKQIEKQNDVGGLSHK